MPLAVVPKALGGVVYAPRPVAHAKITPARYVEWADKHGCQYGIRGLVLIARRGGLFTLILNEPERWIVQWKAER